MSGMFFGTSIFNQPLGTWKLNPNVRFFESFSEVGLFNESGMNCDNYSATLIGWQQNNPNVKGRAMLATGLRYGTNAVAARNALINTQNWQISGDLPSGTLCGSSSTDDKNEENVLKIYPNPSTGKISIKSDFKDVKNIEIRGLDGRIVQVISELKDNEID